GPRGLRCRQRSDGIVPRALAEERPQPTPLADTRRAALRDRPLDRTHLQPSPSSTSTREAHTRRIRARPRRRPRPPGSMTSHNHRQPNVQQTLYPEQVAKMVADIAEEVRFLN